MSEASFLKLRVIIGWRWFLCDDKRETEKKKASLPQDRIQVGAGQHHNPEVEDPEAKREEKKKEKVHQDRSPAEVHRSLGEGRHSLARHRMAVAHRTREEEHHITEEGHHQMEGGLHRMVGKHNYEEGYLGEGSAEHSWGARLREGAVGVDQEEDETWQRESR